MKLKTNELLKAISSGKQLPGKIFVYGEEFFLTEQLIKLIRSRSDVKKFFVDEDAFPSNLYNSLSLSLFSQYTPVIMGAEFLTGTIRSEKERRRFIDFVKMSESVVIVYRGNLDRKFSKSPFYQEIIKSVDYVCASLPLSEKQKLSLVRNKFLKHGIKLSGKELNTIIEMSGSSVENLRSETDKLLLYPGEINQEVLEDLLFSTDSVSVYRLVNYLLKSDARSSLKAIRNLLSKLAPLQILIRIQMHTRKLIKAKLIGDENLSIAKMVRTVSLKQLHEILRVCAETEFLIKSGRMDENIAIRRLPLELQRYSPRRRNMQK